MTQNGVDYSWSRPGGAALAAGGFKFAMRYVPYPGHGGKGLSRPEIDDLRANGIAIGLVFESTAARHLDGYPAGQQDALMCEAAVADLGFPGHLPVYFAVDFDAQPGQYPAINEYQRGAIEVMGLSRVGIYGSFAVIKQAYEAQRTAYMWQSLAWSHGQHYEYRHIYQNLNGQTVNGAAVDYNIAVDGDYGQWEVEDDMDVEQKLKELNEAVMKRMNLIEVGSGDYTRMLAAWDALVAAGIIVPPA